MRVVLALAAVALALVDRTASTSEAASRPNFLILFVVSFDHHGHTLQHFKLAMGTHRANQ